MLLGLGVALTSLALIRPSRSVACRRAAVSLVDGNRDYHVPVLRAEVVDWLITDPSGTYVDCTLGGGGHSSALLDVLAPRGGHLIGVDRDPDALHAAQDRLAAHVKTGAVTLVRSNFGALTEALRSIGCGEQRQLDGLLLDLGVSSHQLDEPSRGFSYMRDGPLDMRMDSSASSTSSATTLTAANILNEWESGEIADVLWKYGEERESRRIARAIVSARPLRTTAELAAVLARTGSRREPKEVTKRCARVFQALRIEVNQEIAELESALAAASRLVRPGGRLAVMSYHSLEDRRVKRLLRSGSFRDIEPPKDAYGNTLAPWQPLTRQPILASDDEVRENSRARSVRLRVGERTENPA